MSKILLASSIFAFMCAYVQVNAAPIPIRLSLQSRTFSGGVATFFYQNGVAGACGQVHSDSDYIAAIDQTRYGDSGAVSSLCGTQVIITNNNNGKTVTVTIADDCPTCDNENSIDLSLGAFTQIATEEEGEVPITWEYVSDTGGGDDNSSLDDDSSSSDHDSSSTDGDSSSSDDDSSSSDDDSSSTDDDSSSTNDDSSSTDDDSSSADDDSSSVDDSSSSNDDSSSTNDDSSSGDDDSSSTNDDSSSTDDDSSADDTSSHW